MATPGSVTFWISQLKSGSGDAARPLLENYFHRLVALARARLIGLPRRAADEEDVALSAFDSFCRAAERGRFSDLNDRDDLWQLLVVITGRKACDLTNHERRQRRGGGRVLDEAAMLDAAAQSDSTPLARFQSREPSPDSALQTAEEFRRLLDALGDDDLRAVALRRLEGYSVEEIALEMGRVPRTVKRWLRLIRQIWEKELRP
jgi:DNA-directed RNA polymerase specialized sigma24 family protein